MYTFKSRVRYSEIDATGTLSLNGVINYMQDCSTFQSEDLGVGIEYLKSKHRAWLLNSWQIVIHRYPKLCEEIEIGTQAYDFSSMFGHRNFILRDSNNQVLAVANSLWILVDTITGHPVKIRKEDVDIYGSGQPLEMEYAGRKILLPKEMEEQNSFIVESYHIDTNNHVNNGQYVQMAMTCIPQQVTITQIRAEYKRQALLHDTIVPYVGKIENEYVVSLNDTNKKPYAVVSFLVSK